MTLFISGTGYYPIKVTIWTTIISQGNLIVSYWRWKMFTLFWNYRCIVRNVYNYILVKSTKKLLVQKMQNSAIQFFQYCNGNIGKNFLFAPSKVIALNLLCFIFDIILLLFQLSRKQYKLSKKKQWIKVQNRSKFEEKRLRATTFERVITRRGVIEKRPMLLSQYWKKHTIFRVFYKLFLFWGHQ